MNHIPFRTAIERMVILGGGLARSGLVLGGLALGFLGAAASGNPGPDAPAVALATSSSDSATIRHTFDDVPHWVSVFDDTARAAWQKPDLLVNALRVAPGHTVADIGAGTGYFNRFFARAVGDSGRVLAVDLEPGLIAHMKARARAEGTPQVEPILAAPDDPHLPSDLDLVFLCNTYHHIDGRRTYFDRLRAQLAPEGRLVIVDFKPGDLPVGPPPGHKLAPAVVMAELGAAGYALADSLDILPYQFVLICRPATADRDR
jgi:SAM-dependent methyltransferase